jgi:CRISPR/Cas system CSM-associated protein Csm5 (group 7 of RAMP superfamily)
MIVNILETGYLEMTLKAPNLSSNSSDMHTIHYNGSRFAKENPPVKFNVVEISDFNIPHKSIIRYDQSFLGKKLPLWLPEKLILTFEEFVDNEESYKTQYGVFYTTEPFLRHVSTHYNTVEHFKLDSPERSNPETLKKYAQSKYYDLRRTINKGALEKGDAKLVMGISSNPSHPIFISLLSEEKVDGFSDYLRNLHAAILGKKY